MTPKQYIATLPSPCEDGVVWVMQNKITSDAQAWSKLDRPHWMLWLIEKRVINLDESKLRHFACDCAEDTLEILEDCHSQWRKSIKVARRFADGKATEKEMRSAWFSTVKPLRYSPDSASWIVYLGAFLAAESCISRLPE